jgi:hypothetical protein
MDPKRGRELVLAAVAIAFIAVAAWTLLRTTANPAGATAGSGTTAASTTEARGKSSLTEVDLKGLEAERPEPADSTRNPFQFKPKLAPPPPPPTVITKQPQAVEQSATMPVEPPLPQIPLKYIGDMSDPKNPGKRIAILSDARSTYYGREGEIVEGRYKILRIGVESIELAYLDGRGRQTIRQTGQ